MNTNGMPNDFGGCCVAGIMRRTCSAARNWAAVKGIRDNRNGHG